MTWRVYADVQAVGHHNFIPLHQRPVLVGTLKICAVIPRHRSQLQTEGRHMVRCDEQVADYYGNGDYQRYLSLIRLFPLPATTETLTVTRKHLHARAILLRVSHTCRR